MSVQTTVYVFSQGVSDHSLAEQGETSVDI